MINKNEWVLVPREPTQAMLDAGHWPCVQGRGAKSVWATMLAAAPQPPAEAQPVGDVGEFGVGIQPNPKARYWQERAEFWKAQAVALGWREKRDAANGETPPSAPVGGGEVRLWDTQWSNIVNAPEVLNAESQEDAVSVAVKMTERMIAKNVAAQSLPPAKVAQQPAAAKGVGRG